MVTNAIRQSTQTTIYTSLPKDSSKTADSRKNSISRSVNQIASKVLNFLEQKTAPNMTPVRTTWVSAVRQQSNSKQTEGRLNKMVIGAKGTAINSFTKTKSLSNPDQKTTYSSLPALNQDKNAVKPHSFSIKNHASPLNEPSSTKQPINSQLNAEKTTYSSLPPLNHSENTLYASLPSLDQETSKNPYMTLEDAFPDELFQNSADSQNTTLLSPSTKSTYSNQAEPDTNDANVNQNDLSSSYPSPSSIKEEKIANQAQQKKEIKDCKAYMLSEEGQKHLLTAVQENKSSSIQYSNHTIHFSNEGFAQVSIKKLGSGGSKTSFKMLTIANGVITKNVYSIPHKQTLSANDQKAFKQELLIHQHLKDLQEEGKSSFSHVAIGKVCKDANGKEGIMTDYCNGGTVDNFSRNSDIEDKERYKAAIYILRGVGQLHKKEIVHRDLKLDNFLIEKTKEGQVKTVKVADFGCARLAENGGHKIKAKEQLPLLFAPPEAFSRGEFSKAGDIYTLGLSFCQLFQAQGMDDMPFTQTSNREEFLDMRKDPKTFPAFGPDSTIDPKTQRFLMKMLAFNDSERPTIDEVEKFFTERSQTLFAPSKSIKA